MAAIQDEMKRWADKLPAKAGAKRKIQKSTQAAVRGLRRSIVPVSKVIGSALLKKATGIALDELFDAATGSGEDDSIAERTRDSTVAAIEAGLDKAFEKSLKEHRERRQAVDDFKCSIASAVESIHQEAGANLPIFVFVDEVDRCRPSYAIKLLEEIKHIFGVANVCYIVSTNLEQLGESVRAVYGSGFDGFGYLRRFFDRIYALPEPNNSNFSKFLLSEDNFLQSRKTEAGLPQTDKQNAVERAVSLIAEAFDLDLRSQKQVFQLAHDAAAAIPPDTRVFILWLFFLCALRHQKPLLFDKILTIQVTASAFVDLYGSALPRNPVIPYTTPARFDQESVRRSSNLIDVLKRYFEWSRSDLKDLTEKNSNINSYDYPNANLQAIANEMPSTYYRDRPYPPSIARYHSLVRYAGMAMDGA